MVREVVVKSLRIEQIEREQYLMAKSSHQEGGRGTSWGDFIPES